MIAIFSVLSVSSSPNLKNAQATAAFACPFLRFSSAPLCLCGEFSYPNVNVIRVTDAGGN